MPSANPFTDHGNGPVLSFAQVVQAGTAAVDDMYTSPNSVTGANAAGTSENVALHLAILVVICLALVFVLRQSGFRFAVAAGVG